MFVRQVAEQQQAAYEQKMADLIRDHDKEITVMKQKHREELASIVSSEKTSLSALYKTQITHLEEEVMC